MDPNCRLSIFSPIDCISQSATKRSHVFDKVAVSEIGRKSLFMSLGALFLGTGITSAFSIRQEPTPAGERALKIEVTGRANTCAYDFRTQFGISSGPTAFEDDIADNLEYTSWTLAAASSNVCLSDESVDMRLLMDVGSCLKMLGG